MKATRPSYALFAEAEVLNEGSMWRFALHATDSDWTIAACDYEAAASEDRLTLLALVRGLEALDQPSDVSLVTRSSSVARGVTRDLADWRNNHWRWERFGRLIPIRDADLWRRVDQALRYHSVSCRTWRFDRPVRGSRGASAVPSPHFRIDAAENSQPANRSDREAHFVDGGPDSPAMVIVPTERARRRVRLSPRADSLAAG